jgi:sugar lactone lactonase YvrE
MSIAAWPGLAGSTRAREWLAEAPGTEYTPSKATRACCEKPVVARLQLTPVAVQVVIEGRMAIGVAPVWDIMSGTLLWAEIGGEAVHRFDPATGRDEPIGLPQPVAAAHPRRRGGLVLTLRDGVALLDPDGVRHWLVYWARQGVAGAAAAVDQTGRLWVATSGDGALLRVEPDGAVAVLLTETNVSAIAFSPDADTMYLADAGTGQIVAADFDSGAGRIGPHRPLALVPGPGGPCGLCVDADGWLWVASGADPAVHRYDPAGTAAPGPATRADPTAAAAHPTGCAFGGIRLTDLYLTAAPCPVAGEPAGPLLVAPDAGEGLPTPVFAG